MEAKDMILICKALSDTNRLEIVRMLSDGEKCGCKILDKFNITQPTLSHHMKILVDCGIVNDRKEGKWHNTHSIISSFSRYISGALHIIHSSFISISYLPKASTNDILHRQIPHLLPNQVLHINSKSVKKRNRTDFSDFYHLLLSIPLLM